MATFRARMIQPCRTAVGGSRRLAAAGSLVRGAAVAVLLGAGLLGACAHSDSGLGPAPGIGGAYTLRAVGADSLPAIVFDSTAVDGPNRLRVTIAITDATMTLSSAGGYVFTLDYTFVVNGVAQPVLPLGDRGTYTRDGATLSFLSRDGQGTMSGTLSDGTLTMAQDLLDDGTPLSLVYIK